MGHPAPFHLTMIGVGNEQWGDRYIERYKIFAATVRAKHPEIQLVVAAGPAPAGEPFESMWSHWRELKADIVDEHYYMDPQWFLTNTARYDHYDRSGPKVFAGEYAAQTSGTTKPDNRNNWKGAIAEAAFMTGLERNADVVQMASYAPLLAHVEPGNGNPTPSGSITSFVRHAQLLRAVRLRQQRRHPHHPRHAARRRHRDSTPAPR